MIVGRVTAVAWPPQQGLAAALADAADRAPPFPGVGPLPDRRIRLILAPTRAKFDSLTRGRLPSWSEGAAFPDAGTVVLLSAGPPDRLTAALRHELAHVALRWRVRRVLPLWFEEGYAAVAAGEWDRLDALRLNWQLARGVHMDLDELDRALRGDRTDAETFFEKTIKLGPNLIEAYYELGRVHWFAGDQAKAKSTWDGGFKANKFNPWGKKCQEMLERVARGEEPPRD